MLSRVGANMQPCMTLFVTGKASVVAIVLDCSTYAIMEFPNDADKLAGAAKLGHDLPKAFPTDSVDDLCKVRKGGVEANILLLAFLLKLSGTEDHVYCAAALSETVLALR